jgi:RNA polymerase sigma-70 factor (ECF subfamily)
MAVVKFPDIQLQVLIQECQIPVRDSQKRFYNHFYGYGLTICLRYLPKREDAVEAMNDSFLKIFKDLKSFVPRNGLLEDSLKAWIRKIFINTSIDNVRRIKKYAFESLDENNNDETHVDETATDTMGYKELIELIGQLSPAYRMVFNLYVIDDYSHEEIAQMLGISIGTSKSNLSKARMNLRKMINIEKDKNNIYERQAV